MSSMNSCRLTRSLATASMSLRYASTRSVAVATFASRSSNDSRSAVARYWVQPATAIDVIQITKTANAIAAAVICNLDDMVMQRTWPSDRMKNSRSGNQPRTRFPQPVVANGLLKTTRPLWSLTSRACR